jgi:hypothetical protein
MASLKLDHILLLESSKNSEWSKSMHLTLLGEDPWTYIAEGTDTLEYSTPRRHLDPPSLRISAH